MKLEYVNVNEEGEEYQVSSNLDIALGTLAQYPNDTVVVRYVADEPPPPEDEPDDDALDLRDDIEAMLDRFDEILIVAESRHYTAVQHKLEEAAAPLASAREAAEQYGTGVLKRKEAS